MKKKMLKRMSAVMTVKKRMKHGVPKKRQRMKEEQKKRRKEKDKRSALATEVPHKLMEQVVLH